MTEITACFFDLDGTIVDSRPGLLNAFRLGVAALGVPEPTEAELAPFLGTPLPDIFRAFRPGLSQAALEDGIAAFRAYYERDGIAEAKLYPGARDTLRALAAAGNAPWIVTSKPALHAERVIALFGLDRFVQGTVGAGFEETDTKTTLIAAALLQSGADPARTLMLGDRHYDIIGARENGVLPVGALWGYGSRAEFERAGCRHFATSFGDFRRQFMAHHVPTAAVA